MNGAAPAAVGGGRFDVLTEKKASDLAMLADGTAAGFDSDAAADDGLVMDEAGGGLASAAGDLVIAEPAGNLEMEGSADD